MNAVTVIRRATAVVAIRIGTGGARVVGQRTRHRETVSSSCSSAIVTFTRTLTAGTMSRWERFHSNSVASIAAVETVAEDDSVEHDDETGGGGVPLPTESSHTDIPPSQQLQQQQDHDRNHHRHYLRIDDPATVVASTAAAAAPPPTTIATTTTTTTATTTISRPNHHLSSEALRIPTVTQPPQSEMSDILSSYDKLLRERTACHFGYPYNLQFDYQELVPFLQYLINNLGDPYVASNYGVHSRQFEIAVIDYFAQLWKMDVSSTNSNNNNINQTLNTAENNDSYWGYVTASGTEGNLHGLLLARECFPDGILYTSQETHYSVFKAARYYRMECQVVPTVPNGEINYDILAAMIRRHKKNGNHHHHHHNNNSSTGSSNDSMDTPIILNLNIGTTVKGAIDDIDRIVQILHQENIPREKFYIHCDGALFALMIPFLTTSSPSSSSSSHRNNNEKAKPPVVSFATQPIDSIAVSGHKMLGCPMPCGVALCRKEHITRFQGQHIDYLNSIDTTIMGSRNGHAALYLWYALRTKGTHGLQQDVDYCIETAQYLRHRLEQDVHVPCALNPYSSTVVFERPMDASLIQKWQLACSDDIAHIVVMPNITRIKIDQFVDEYRATIATQGRIQSSSLHSPLSQLQSKLW